MKFWSSIRCWGALFSPKSNLWPTCVSGLTRKKPSVWWASQLQNDSPFFTWPAPNSLMLLGWVETHLQTLAGQSFRNAVPRIGLQENLQKPPTLHVVVSWNRATPSSHPFIDGNFHYKPTIVGYPPWLWKTTCGVKKTSCRCRLSPWMVWPSWSLCLTPLKVACAGSQLQAFQCGKWIDIHIHIQKICKCIWLCLWLCVCVGVCVCVYVHVYVCVYVCVCVCVYVICICLCIRPYVYMSIIYMNMCIYIYMYRCIDMCLNFWCLRISCKLWKALSTTGDTTVYDALIGCCHFILTKNFRPS